MLCGNKLPPKVQSKLYGGKEGAFQPSKVIEFNMAEIHHDNANVPVLAIVLEVDGTLEALQTTGTGTTHPKRKNTIPSNGRHPFEKISLFFMSKRRSALWAHALPAEDHEGGRGGG